jgi:flagellar biosynthesis anti-sigma factor FlgM
MRIDLNAISPEALDPQQSTKPGSQPVSGSASAAANIGVDTAKLSPDQARVQQLASQVNQLPEIRRDKVTALQGAVQAGTYQVTPAQTAGALFSAMQRSPAY